MQVAEAAHWQAKVHKANVHAGFVIKENHLPWQVGKLFHGVDLHGHSDPGHDDIDARSDEVDNIGGIQDVIVELINRK